MRSIILLLLSLNPLFLFAQSDLIFTHYMFTGQTFNPAMVLSSGGISATLTRTNLRNDFGSAPQTTNFTGSYSNPWCANALGMNLHHHSEGFYTRTKASMSGSYTRVIGIGRIGAGLALELAQIRDKAEETSENLFDVSFGLLYTSPKLLLGVSSTQMNESDINSSFGEHERNYYIHGRYKIHISNDLLIYPTLLIHSKATSTTLHTDILANYRNMIFLGSGYRHHMGRVLPIIAGVRILDKFQLIYSYDMLWNISETRGYISGNHQVSLGYGALSL